MVLSHNIAQDEAFKNQLLMLAYLSILSFPVHYLPSFICDFLDFKLLDRDDQNEETVLAVNRLLFNREYFDKGGYLLKKPFSKLILTLDKQNQDHALAVFDHTSELIDK